MARFFCPCHKALPLCHPKVTRAWVTEVLSGDDCEEFSRVFPLTTRVLNLGQSPALLSPLFLGPGGIYIAIWVSLTAPIDQHILPITLQKFAVLPAHGEEHFLSAIVRSPVESFSCD